MVTSTISNDGSIHLPDAIRESYGLTCDRPFRIIEMKVGILIVPLTDGPMDAELVRELEEWQALGQETLELHNPEPSSPPQFELEQFHRDIPDQELLDELLRVARLFDRNFVTIGQFKEHAKYASSTLCRRFGTWFKAHDAAGLGKSMNRNITNEQLFKILPLFG